MASTVPSGFTSTGLRWHFETPIARKANMTTARHYAASSAIGNKLYVSGGSSNGTLQSALQVYDVTNNSWSILAAMPATLYSHDMAAYNGKLYSIGGIKAGAVSTINYRYDTSTNTWSTMTAMSTARQGAMAAVVGGKIHIIGGSTNVNGTAFTTSHEVYDIAGNSWSTAAALPTARGYAGIAVVGGKIHVMGGNIAGITTVATHDVYDTSTNTWSSAADLPSTRYQMGAAEAGGMLYVMGGVLIYPADDPSRNDCLQYDPATDAWYSLNSTLSVPRYSAVPWAIGGKLYVTGGYTGSASTNVTEEFTPPTTLYLVQKN